MKNRINREKGMRLQNLIPSFYQNLMPPEILEMNPIETKATCNNCAMDCENRATREGLTSTQTTTYDLVLKCCTYQPFLPNFVVGALLEDQQLPQRNVINEFLKTRKFALPIGLVPPLHFQVEFNHREENDFGNRLDWLCPYYDWQNSQCGIWTYRSSVCTTFYCQSSYGKKGLNFWKDFEHYYSFIEMALMEECLAMLDFSPRQVSELIAFLNRTEATQEEILWKELPLDVSRRLWNFYFDEQEIFYKKCFQIVREMKRPQFEELVGDRLPDEPATRPPTRNTTR
jgi:hypothetical protein